MMKGMIDFRRDSRPVVHRHGFGLHRSCVYAIIIRSFSENPKGTAAKNCPCYSALRRTMDGFAIFMLSDKRQA